MASYLLEVCRQLVGRVKRRLDRLVDPEEDEDSKQHEDEADHQRAEEGQTDDPPWNSTCSGVSAHTRTHTHTGPLMCRGTYKHPHSRAHLVKVK